MLREQRVDETHGKNEHGHPFISSNFDRGSRHPVLVRRGLSHSGNGDMLQQNSAVAYHSSAVWWGAVFSRRNIFTAGTPQLRK